MPTLVDDELPQMHSLELGRLVWWWWSGLLLAFGNCKCPRSGENLRQMWCRKRLVYPLHALHGSGQLSNPRGLVPRKVMVTHRSSPSSVRLIVVVLGEESIFLHCLISSKKSLGDQAIIRNQGFAVSLETHHLKGMRGH
jgi:hypothetical protein